MGVELERQLAGRLPTVRWKHSVGTAATARRLAPRAGVSEEKAWVAGLVHDLARDMPESELLSLAVSFGILVGNVERQAPELLHGPVGAELARREFGIEDVEILGAVADHTVGGPAMAPLSLLLYLADFIEPGRHFPGVEEVRAEAERDLELAALWAMEKTLCYLFHWGLPAHPRTVEGRNWLLQRLQNEGRWRSWTDGPAVACLDRRGSGGCST